MTHAEDSSDEKLRTVTDVDSVVEYLNNYVRPYTTWYEKVAKKNHRYLSWSRVLAMVKSEGCWIYSGRPHPLRGEF
jgi:hypothetical protein